MQQSHAAQLCNHIRQATCGVKLIHICRTIWIHASEQWDDFTQIVHVFPAQFNARHARNCHDVQGVVGRAARCQQANHTIDNGFFIDQLRHAQFGMVDIGQQLCHRTIVQRAAQWCGGIDKRATW